MTEEEVRVKCPDCGSDELELPENIEEREGGIYFKDTNLRLLSLPDPAYSCSKCGRKISSSEVFKYLEANGVRLELK